MTGTGRPSSAPPSFFTKLPSRACGDTVMLCATNRLMPAATRPTADRDNIARLLVPLFGKAPAYGLTARPIVANGQPALVTLDAHDRVVNVVTLEIAQGHVHAVRIVMNPDTLRHIGPASDVLQRPHLHPDSQP